MKNSLYSVLALAPLLLTQVAKADSPIYCNGGRLTTYAFCKIKTGVVQNQNIYDVYMGFCNQSGLNLYAPNGTDNQLTPPVYTTVPALLPENFPSNAPANRNDYAFLVKSVEENRNLTWHVKPTVGPNALSNTTPTRVEDLPNCTKNPLPVELTRFDAAVSARDASRVDLTWSTASEKNSERFDVQESTDGVAFRTLGNVAAAGNTSTARNYSFTTPSLTNGMHYFRLKQIDLDGKNEFSPVRAISARGNSSAFTSIYPNPAERGSSVTVSTASSEASLVEIMDANGRTVMSVTGVSPSVETGSLQPGMYFVKTTAAGNTKIDRLMIK